MRGLYMAEGAMLTQQSRTETVGNNLANQRTAGYKRDDAVQTSFAEWLLYARNTTGEPQSPYPVGTMAHNVATAESYTSMKDGVLEQTGRSLDFALNGNGFFQVEVDDEVLYSRNGHFFLNADGFLVNAEGHLVLGENGPISMLDSERGASVDIDRELVVEEDGSIFINGEYIDTFDLAPFDPEANYTKTGDNYFEPVETDAELIAMVQHKHLEGSNVDLAEEMVKLMEIRRNYEAAQKIMFTYDGLLNKAANEIGSLG